MITVSEITPDTRLEVGSGMSIDLLKRESVGSLLDRASQRMRNRRSA